MTDDPMMEVPLSRLQALRKAEKMLEALEAAGVDNWEGYSEAFQYLEDYDPDE